SFARGLQQTIDQRGGNTMWSRGKHGASRRLDEQLLDFRLRLEPGIREGAHQVRKRVSHRLARLAVRHHRRQLELRVSRNQAQHLTGPVAGAAEHDCWNSCTHAATPALTPIASITRSPRAAPFVMALNAETPIWVVMISTPTALSVDGPVTTQG